MAEEDFIDRGLITGLGDVSAGNLMRDDGSRLAAETEARFSARIVPLVGEALDEGLGGTVTSLVAAKADAEVTKQISEKDVLTGSDPRVAGDVETLVRWARTTFGTYALPFQSGNGKILGGFYADGTAEFLKLKNAPGAGSEGTTVSSKKVKVACGDSLTEGYSNGVFWPNESWPKKLEALDPHATVVNLGWSGCMMDEVALRLGALPLVAQASVTVPASGSVSFTTQSGVGWHDTAERSLHGKLGTVAGTLVHAGAGGTTVTFTPDSGGSSSTVPAGTWFVSDNGFLDYDWATLIVGGGRNNLSRGVKGNNATVAEHVVAGTVRIVNWLKAQNKRFLLWGTLNASGERTGSANHATALLINNTLKELYPNVFVDVRGWLVRDAIYEQGKTPSAADLTNITGDAPPMAVMDDSVHFSKQSATGISALFGKALERREWKAYSV